MSDDVGAQIAAVRALHTQRLGTRRRENGVELNPPKKITFCSECEFVEWPCPTIRALEAAAPRPTEGALDDITDAQAIAYATALGWPYPTLEVVIRDAKREMARNEIGRRAALAARHTVAGGVTLLGSTPGSCNESHKYAKTSDATRETAAQECANCARFIVLVSGTWVHAGGSVWCCYGRGTGIATHWKAEPKPRP